MSAALPVVAQRAEAAAWFESLRARICAAFEALEDAYAGPLADRPAGRSLRGEGMSEGVGTTRERESSAIRSGRLASTAAGGGRWQYLVPTRKSALRCSPRQPSDLRSRGP